MSRSRSPRAARSIVALVLLSATLCHAATRDEKSTTLSFEDCGEPGCLERWNGTPSGPLGTLFIDSTVVHGGRYAGRLERSATSPSTFSSFAIELPVDFGGDTLEVRGWLRMEGVTGFAGLWLREDPTRQFDNMAQRHLAGTRDWEKFSVRLPLDRNAKTMNLGALLVGEGKVWADDLEIRVDGRPLAEAPERAKTALDTDHEFDRGSGVAATAISTRQIENLALLCKTWGFLKYHEPRVVKGEFHWDYELFRVLPAVLAARDRPAARTAMLSWMARLGPVTPCSTCAGSPAGRPMEPPLAWLGDRALLGDSLSSRLKRIHANRPVVDAQFFVSLGPGAGNPDFGNELVYRDTIAPDPGYRLLALFRLWNIIQYWSPDRDIAGQDWDKVLREFIPRLMAATTRDDYKLALMAFIARLNDGHANLWRVLNVRPPRGTCSLPVSLRFLGDTLVVTGYTHPELGPATGLAVGDVIRKIGGARVDSLVTAWSPYYAASNEAARRRDLAFAITQGPCDSVALTIARGGKARTLVAKRVPSSTLQPPFTHDHAGETFRRLSDDLAYLKLSSVKVADCPDYIRRAEGARCLVIDIRNYPSEFVVFALGQHLVEKATPFVVFTNGDLANPGSFRWTDSLSLAPESPRFAGRVAILVDEVTQSQAEYTTMAFRVAPGAVVAGSTTAGADGNVSPLQIPGGISTMISGIGVFYPDHRPTQRIGIVPDLTVRPTVAGLRAGRDEVMEAAVFKVLGRAMTDAEHTALRTH